MVTIDKEKCIGCGNCVKDCFAQMLEIKEGKAQTLRTSCMECGHCLALCPTKAISFSNFDMNEVLEFSDIDQTLDAQTYLNHLKSRRSIRRFKNTPVLEEDVKKIIEAGRFSPTGGNLQNVAYYVSRKDVDAFKDMLHCQLKCMADQIGDNAGQISWYAKMWQDMYEEFKKDGTDKLFFNAGTVIVISSNSPQSGCIAAAHMETMIYSMGLGMLYSGFSERAINTSEEIRSYLHMKEGYDCYAVLVIGHPDVQYIRTVPRKEAEVIWN